MALISCPECSKEISDKAVFCPNCGVPIGGEVESPQVEAPPEEGAESVEQQPQQVEVTGVKVSNKIKKAIIISVAAVLVIVSLFVIMNVVGTSEEARQVIERIDEIEIVTLSTIYTIREIEAEYNLLSESEQQRVRNFSRLEELENEYNILLINDLTERIETATNNIDTNSEIELERLIEESANLEEMGLGKPTNFERLIEALQEVQHTAHITDLARRIDDVILYVSLDSETEINDLINELNELELSDIEKPDNYELLFEAKEILDQMIVDDIIETVEDLSRSLRTGQAIELVRENRDILTNEDIKECLLIIGRWDSVYEAEEAIKRRLVSPTSFRRLSARTMMSALSPRDDGSHIATVRIEYEATNRMGGSVRDSQIYNVFFDIDYINIEIIHRGVEWTFVWV